MAEEPPLDPDRPIIDPHLHLWEPMGRVASPRFLVHEAAEMIAASGQNITHTVFLECHAMHRADGPEELRPVGETEFVAGQAAMSASGNYGPAKIAHRIVGTANLLLGSAVAPVLEAHVAAGGGRFRGIRMGLAYCDEGMFGWAANPEMKGIMARPAFREGANELAKMGLSLDVWCFHSQLPELIRLADALPDLGIVLDHVGTPLDRSKETRETWAASIRELANRPNVTIKLGGLGMDIASGIGTNMRWQNSEALEANWRPYLDVCLQAFGAKRAMFESNFPPDNDAGSYGAVWNAFKLFARHCSDTEKDDLFRRTAARIYAIDLDEGAA